MSVESKPFFGLVVISLLFCTTGSLCAQENDLQSEEQIYQFEPDTPERLVRAAVVAVQLDRIRVAREYLRKIVESELATDEWVALRRELGVDPFLTLNANRDLTPYAGQLLDQINNAANESVRPPSDAAELISQLASDSRFAAVQAAADLVAMGDIAVPALLDADTSIPSGRIASQLLQRHSRARRYGLMNALPAADGNQQERILQMLRGSADPFVAEMLLPYEFGPYAPSIQRAASLAIDDVWYSSARPVNGDQAAHWLTGRAIEALRTSSNPFANRDPGERLRQAIGFTNAASAIAPHLESVSSIGTVALLAAGQGSADELDEFERGAALDVALDVESGPAVLALLTDDPERLFRAMHQPDPHVRIAAATRVLRLNRRVRGCSLARDILHAAANGSSKTEAVVIDSRDELGQTAFILRDPEGTFQYDVRAASTGKAGFEAAASQLQTELILVHSNCLYWDLSPTIANLRSDYRTRNVPIVIYGPDWVAGRIASLQSRYPGVWFVEEPLSSASFVSELAFQNVSAPSLSAEVRGALIEAAREVLAAHENHHSAVEGDGVIWYGATSMTRHSRRRVD